MKLNKKKEEKKQNSFLLFVRAFEDTTKSVITAIRLVSTTLFYSGSIFIHSQLSHDFFAHSDVRE